MNTPALIDGFGRRHTNLRISVTDRCNLRCFYCMPEHDAQFMPRQDLLTFEEIERFVRIVVPLGVNKIRLTGGEPLVRNDLPVLVEKLAAIEGIHDLGLTTNGILLAEQAQALYRAGLRRLNVSLDVLDPVLFREVTRRDGYDRVLAGIDEARRVGFDPIKINAVSIRGITETQIVPLALFARETGCEIRFIEYMPLDAQSAWEREKVLFAEEIVHKLSAEIQPLLVDGEQTGPSPARQFRFADGQGRIGFIPSVSQPFCESCNRFRLTADGKIRNCLFSLEETDIRTPLRSQASEDDVRRLVQECIRQKWAGHHINDADFLQPLRPMYSIGG
jgi:cyclic pyranopterin phosphate synthase